MASQEEIFEKVQGILMEALAVDDDEVTPDASLVEDLGAESIDFLDIIFQLEKAFDITIPRDQLFPEEVFTDSQYVEEGVLNEAGLAELKKRMPFVDFSKFEQDPQVQNFGGLLTVQDLCNYLESRVNA